MRRVAVYAATKNLYHQMAVAARSLLNNTRMDRVIFLTEDDDFPEDLPKTVEIMNVSDQKWFDPAGPNFRCAWTYMTLMRLALPELLPEESRCLWLDVDTIVNRDIGALFDMDLGGCVVAAVAEPGRSSPPLTYHNAGVLLMDLDRLRGRKSTELIRIVNTRRLSCPDQDAINIYLQPEILTLPQTWNASDFTGPQPQAARIIHYAGRRDYHKAPLWREYEAMSWPEEASP